MHLERLRLCQNIDREQEINLSQIADKSERKIAALILGLALRVRFQKFSLTIIR